MTTTIQADCLDLVKQGRVTYGDPTPELTRRAAAAQGGRVATTMGRDVVMPTNVSSYALTTWLIDGHAAGTRGRTLTALEQKQLIVVHYDEWPEGDTGTVRVTVA